jgi:hypothetical protein
MRRLLVLVVLAALSIWAVAACRDQLPPLVRGTTAVGGRGDACPHQDDHEVLALSPELNQRLRDEFPPGSREDRLIATLIEQGFTIDSGRGDDQACKNDKSVHGADFYRVLWIGTKSAVVYWKTDQHGNLLWTKGFVFNGG